MVVGSFLPWLYSGSRSRNSYRTSGVARELLGIDGVGELALRAWPFIGVTCGLAVAALLLNRQLIAAVLGLLAAVGGAAAAVTMLSTDGNGVFRPAGLGPIVTLVGSIAAIAAITIRLIFKPS